VEVCEVTITPNESDMGLPHTNAILIMCGTGGDSLITVEGS